jgi:hypothetical protein
LKTYIRKCDFEHCPTVVLEIEIARLQNIAKSRLYKDCRSEEEVLYSPSFSVLLLQ